MKILGAIIAGGASTRFGSDKAAALMHGRALLDHVVADMKCHVDALVVVGRAWPELLRVEDKPAPGLGATWRPLRRARFCAKQWI